MALADFFGCFLLAFGPPFWMFVLTVAKDPILVIVLITSSFFWLVSLLFSAFFWYVIKSMSYSLEVAVIVSIILQELFRYLFYLFIRKAEKDLKKVQADVTNKSHHSQFDSKVISYVSGLGFGIISGAFSLINLLGDMTGPGSIGLHGESQLFFLLSASIALCFILLHTCWNVIMFLSLSMYNSKSFQRWLSIFIVLFSHFFVSGLTLLNNSKSPSTYIFTVLFSYLALVSNAGFAFYILKCSVRHSIQ